MKRFPFLLRLIAAAMLSALTLTAAAATALRPVATVQLPDTVESIAVSPMTNTIYLVTPAGVLHFMDGSSHRIFDSMTLSTPNRAVRITIDPFGTSGDILLLATWNNITGGNGQLWQIDTRTHAQTLLRSEGAEIDRAVPGVIGPWYGVDVSSGDDAIDTVPAGFRLNTSGHAWDLALNQKNQVLYTVDYDGLLVYNTNAHQSAHVDVKGRFHDFVNVNPITGKVYVGSNGFRITDVGDQRFAVVGGVETNNSVLRIHPIETMYGTAVVNSTTNEIYTCGIGGHIFNIDGGTDDATLLLDLDTYTLMINQTTGRIYADPSAGATEIDPNMIVPPFTTPGTAWLAGINPVTNRIYFLDNDKLKVFDGTTAIVASRFKNPNASGVGAMSMDVANNETFIANSGSNNVTLINGVSGNSTISFWTYPTAGSPVGIATNPLARKTYVVNAGFFGGKGSVDIIKRPNLSVSANVPVGNNPGPVAVNPVTGRAYVLNVSGIGRTAPPPSLSVIGENDTVIATILTGGTQPQALAVNRNTNAVYVTNFGTNNVTVIDANTNTIRTKVAVAAGPNGIAVDPVTNRAYVACENANVVTVIHPNDTTATIPAGMHPTKVALNESTHRVYVLNEDSQNVTVIDGDSYQAIATVPIGGTGSAIAVDEGSNRVFVTVPEWNFEHIAVIDGTTNNVSQYPVAGSLGNVIANPRTGTVYAGDAATDEIAVIDLAENYNPAPHVALTQTLAGDVTSDPTPTFSVRVDNATRDLPVRQVYYQVDRFDGAWKRADVSNQVATFDLTQLRNGPHTLYFMSADEEARSPHRDSTREAEPIRVGSMASYGFSVACTGISLTANIASVGAAQGSYNVGVIGQCSWAAQTNVPWIQLGNNVNGAGSGTVTYTVTANTGLARTGVITIGGQTLTVNQAASPSPHTDFNNDGRADIIWRHFGNGMNAIWLMNGTSHTGNLTPPSEANLNASIEGTGDFNADGKIDIVWRNYTTGDNYVWFMDGATYLGTAMLTAVGDLNWKIEGVADFTSDKKPDLLWRNYATGSNAIWQMNGTTFVGSVLLPIADPKWRLEGTADFDLDGNYDLFFRYTGTGGQNAIWYLKGTTYQTSSTAVSATPDLNWNLEWLGDLNYDGRPDLLWRNYATGKNSVWFMSNTTTLGYGVVEDVLDTQWHLDGAGPGAR